MRTIKIALAATVLLVIGNTALAGYPQIGYGSASQPYEQFVADAGGWLLARQSPNGSYPFSTASPFVAANLQSISGLATLSAYQATCSMGSCETDYLDAAVLTGNYLIDGGFGNFSPNTGFPRIREFDPLFLVRLSSISGDPQYAQFLADNFWGRLQDGEYGPTNNWGIGDFVDHLIAQRGASSAASAAVAAWDLGLLALAASEAGISQFDAAIVDGTRTALNAGADTSTDLGAAGFDVMGLIGGAWVAGVTGANVVPTEGSWAGAASNTEFVDILLAQQAGEGGFLQSTAAGNDPIDVTDTVSQSTAFAALALADFDSASYFSAISSAMDALVNVFQDPTGRVGYYHPDVDPDSIGDPKPFIHIHSYGLFAVAELAATLGPAPAAIDFSDLIQTYTGSPLAPTVITDPPGLSVTMTYDGEPDAPIDAGSYAVVATIEDPNYTGSATDTFLIERAQAVIEFADLIQTFTGSPIAPTITTDPAGLAILVTYDDDPEPPTEPGIYLVEVLVDEQNYSGWNSALFHILGDQIHRDLFETRPLRGGEAFTDCEDCPTMVVIPAGSFTQGSPESEPQSWGSERPQREVNVPAFGMSQKAVTFDEWDACVDAGACSHVPFDFWGRGDQPVIMVSWNDAQQYVDWLSGKTGRDYRLPSESEWEYAARAGTTGRFNTGDCITTEQANFSGDYPAQGCPVGSPRGQTLPVGSFAANAFGLFDTHGNVYEWVQDCWNANYNDAPVDGSAWMTGDCSVAVLRGGSWNAVGHGLRSAARLGEERATRTGSVGFRVVRSVTL